MSCCHSQSQCTAIFSPAGGYELPVDRYLGTKSCGQLAVLEADQESGFQAEPYIDLGNREDT